jgi:hypothetical protein
MNRLRHDLVTRLWRGRDPFLDLPPDLRGFDMRRASQGPAYVGPAVTSAHPGVVVDIGAGTGGSAIAFAGELRNGRLDAVVVAVDTFLGDVTDWVSDDKFDAMEYEAGRTALYPHFVSNVLKAGLGNFVLPLTLDAMTAAALFARLGIPASIVHLDASDDAVSIGSYLRAWWPLLVPGGMLIGGPCGNGHEAARDTYEAFFVGQSVQAIFQDGTWQAVKPGTAVAAVPPLPSTSVAASAAEPAIGLAVDTPRKPKLSSRLGGRPVTRGAADGVPTGPPSAAAVTAPEPVSAPTVAEAADEPPKVARRFRLGGHPVPRISG